MSAPQPGIESTTPGKVEQSDQDHINALNKIIRNCKTCMLTTRGDDGQLHSRPMGIASLDEFESGKGECIYFVTDRNTTKVKEIEHATEVALCFSNDSSHQWASVSAHASVVEDKEKTAKLWNPMYNSWFPEGPNTPGVVLIKAIPLKASYWEGSALNHLNIMFSALKARITHHPIDQRQTQDSQTVVFPATAA